MTTTPAKSRQYAIPECPACSHARGTEYASPERKFHFVYVCGKCNGVFSNNIYLGDSYSIVSPFMTDADVPEDRVRYFDFTCVGSKGVTRRHGWYDTQTKKIVQVG